MEITIWFCDAYCQLSEQKGHYGLGFSVVTECKRESVVESRSFSFGALSYKPHPETGMLSVSEVHFLVRKWNVKECYLVRYSALKDFEESKNQWFGGPVKAMTTTGLENYRFSSYD
jgi:hypothetical protein